MGETIRIFVCELLREEVRQALAQEGLGEVEVHSYAVDFARPGRALEDLESKLVEAEPVGTVVILGSEWLTSPPTIMKRGWAFVPSRACTELLAGPGALEQARSRRGLLTFPGALRRWREMLGASSLASASGRELFASQYSEIVVLDTGVGEDMDDAMGELSAFLGLTISRLSCGLDFLRLHLARAFLEARLERELERARDELKAQARMRSEYAMAFDLLQRMSHSVEEVAVIGSIMEILQMLFSPAEADYYSFGPEGDVLVFDYATGALVRTKEVDAQALLSRTGTWDEAAGGFKIRIEDKGHVLGVAVLRRLATPEFHQDHLDLGSQLSVVFGLAVANARAYRYLRETETQVERAFAMERTMLEISQGFFARQDFDKAVHDALARAGEAMGASRALLLRFSKDMRSLSATHEWHSASAASARLELAEIPVHSQGWLLDSLQTEGTVRLVDMASLDGAAKDQLEPFHRVGVRSMVLATVALDGRHQGLVCVQHTDPAKGFEPDETNMLRFLAQTLSMALQRRKNQEDLVGMAEAVGMSNKVLRHDIRNELMVLTGSLQLYEMKRDVKHLERAKRSSDRLTEILDHFKELDLFLQSSQGLFPVDLGEAIKKAMAPHQIVYRVEGQGTVMADHAINSVLDNLARNAIKHGEADSIAFTIRGQGPFVELLVSDDGSGIPQEARPRLFQEGFSYGEARGTGLGLFWIRKTMERYGGWVRLADSQKGAAFSLGFPAA